ncbi:CitG family protein [Granulibacter bethesdensis]|uniref:CitG family protein n=2 Tax=Granulibacter bethesdensis TaxID=364410 RepID=A0AAC9KDB0_9PROT|nr:CitG family protein [Granulibacter bethesdensis]APH61605.1 CitG family protein [Granulibacter bethesdensis]
MFPIPSPSNWSPACWPACAADGFDAMNAAFAAEAFIDACLAELEAPKPGNIHAYADGHGATMDDFIRSARAAAPALCRSGTSLGPRIRDAAQATWDAVQRNTNIGILLLCAPLAMAFESGEVSSSALHDIIAQTGLEDTSAIFHGIVILSPGGLGEAAEHDVRAPATVPILTAMQAAAGHDMIARQWSSGFQDILGQALPIYTEARKRWPDRQWAALAVFLHFLSTGPDSHIVRNFDAKTAETTRQQAEALSNRIATAGHPQALLTEILAFDSALKAAGINPGTSADLTVATIFAYSLSAHLAGSRR